ncbi:YktB family protein [Pseudalkalibacillus sp. Hm43]|uniref:YktB family protein n=1 Tax=Pseudalkalibacillus sp. Hm43 TaxID=3450742 RepID=UPI003F433AA5
MSFNGFSKDDFNVFTIQGLEARMEGIQNHIRPKLEQLGEHFAPTLSAATGEEMYYHTAKHARRTVNPPDDTWVAFANSNRGYKKLPHFQIGLFQSHLFVWFAVIYESPIKQEFADKIADHQKEILKQIPNHYVWSTDHTKPDAIPHTEVDVDKFNEMTKRLKDVKKAELLCGIHIPHDDEILQDGEALLSEMDRTFHTLMPLYEYARGVYVSS